MKYIIYSKETGKIFRGLDNITTYPDGSIVGNVNGMNLLKYPASIIPATVLITDEEFTALGADVDKYIVVDGKIVDKSNADMSVNTEPTVEELVYTLLGVN
jgi:hypothetical protein